MAQYHLVSSDPWICLFHPLVLITLYSMRQKQIIADNALGFLNNHFCISCMFLAVLMSIRQYAEEEEPHERSSYIAYHFVEA